MFGGTSLTTAPELPATTLANYCYSNMFSNCTSLTTAPELPATTLANNCYSGMFDDCSRLTTAPELPATTLANYCYRYMFSYCSRLTTAPELPATTLANSCYDQMFYGCSSLTTAPELPATTLENNCYRYMFYYCSKLNYIKMLATDISASSCLTNWVSGVASSGTFVKNPAMNSLPTGVSGIPSGWTVMNDGEEIVNIDNYLTIEALEDGLTASLSANSCEYCVDGDGDWKSLAAGTPTENINSGHTLSFRGELTPTSSNGIGTFTISKKCNLKGNCMSMLFGDNATDNYSLSGKYYAFDKLFYNCTNIVNVSENFLPATTLANHCYNNMFYGCSSLTTAPELPATKLSYECCQSMFNGCSSLTTVPSILPATTLVNDCYRFMFYGCTSLTAAPELPATTLANNCYDGMFANCSSLTTAPELPATTLANSCYKDMFGGCTSLITSPELPATTLENKCYYYMFYGCTKLNYIKMLATDISASDCLNNWVNGVATVGTFVKNPAMSSLPTGESGIPSGWPIVNDGEESNEGYNYLTIEALEDGLTARLSANSCEYCVDGDGDWKTLSSGTITQSINSGQTLSFRGNLTPNSSRGIGTFTINKKCNLKGNCMSMLFGDNADNNFSLSGKNYAFYKLFYNCTNIVNVSENFLPATTLADHCYNNMFYGCTSLTVAPSILPATTLAVRCYNSMFQKCTSLTTAPELPATTLVNLCYYNMFNGCTKLNYIKMLATDISASSCLTNWVSGVTSSGIFVKNPSMNSLPTGVSGIPSGWTVMNDGEESGGGENIIQFSVQDIDGQVHTFNAENGMTWEEWVKTDYNTHGVFIAENSFLKTSPWLTDYYVIIDPQVTIVKPSDNFEFYDNLIKADYSYSVKYDMGSPS